jgi:hypothetical protein
MASDATIDFLDFLFDMIANGTRVENYKVVFLSESCSFLQTNRSYAQRLQLSFHAFAIRLLHLAFHDKFKHVNSGLVHQKVRNCKLTVRWQVSY